MRSFIRSIVVALTAAGAALTIGYPQTASADTGTVRLQVTKGGFIIGGGGGQGVLHYHGKNYPFHIGGVSAGTIGIAGANLTGTASRLHSPPATVARSPAR